MFSLAISLFIALGISGACVASHLKSGTVAYAIIGFIISQIGFSLWVRKRSQVLSGELQELMEQGQKRIQHKVHLFQSKPGGNPRIFQQQMERDQKEMFRVALEFTERFEVFKKWNVLMGKQMLTMQLQFLYQLKEFDRVDEIFAKNFVSAPFLSDPLLVAMKMARLYKNKDSEGAEKVFNRYSRWFRQDNGALLYGVISWIYVKDGKIEEARQLLGKAKDKMYNEVLARNWEMLSNNRVKSFSNAGFADAWYGLYLENPPAPKRQQVRANGKGRRPF